MPVEPGQGEGMTHHTLVLVQYDETAGTHHGPLGKTTVGKTLIIHHPGLPLGRLQQEIRRQDGNGGTSRDTGFQPFAVRDTAAIFIGINKLFYGNGHIDLIHPRLIDIAAGREQFGAGRLPDPDLRVFFAPDVQDRYDSRQGLHIVDHGRTIPDAFHSRKRGFDTGVAPLAFQRLDQGRLFPADIGAGAPVHIDLAVKSRSQDIRSEKAIGLRFCDSLFQDIGDPGIFAPDIDIGALAAQGIRGDDQSFDQQVRQELHQVTVLESSRFRLIGITYQVTGHSLRFREKAPFHTRWKPGAATSTQPTLLHFIRHLVGGHGLQGFFHAGITAFPAIHLEAADARNIYFVDQ